MSRSEGKALQELHRLERAADVAEAPVRARTSTVAERALETKAKEMRDTRRTKKSYEDISLEKIRTAPST